MSACGSCPSCAASVPICVGNICVKPEEAVISGGFLFAGFIALFNFFVAQRDAVKRKLSQGRRMVIFVLIPAIVFALAVQYNYVEIPTMEAIQNTIYGVNTTATESIATGHGHSHGHAAWHGGVNNGHVGHFHEKVRAHLAKEL